MTKTDRLRGLARYSNPRSVPDESALPGPANPWVFPLAHGLSARVHADEDGDLTLVVRRAGPLLSAVRAMVEAGPRGPAARACQDPEPGTRTAAVAAAVDVLREYAGSENDVVACGAVVAPDGRVDREATTLEVDSEGLAVADGWDFDCRPIAQEVTDASSLFGPVDYARWGAEADRVEASLRSDEVTLVAVYDVTYRAWHDSLSGHDEHDASAAFVGWADWEKIVDFAGATARAGASC